MSCLYCKQLTFSNAEFDFALCKDCRNFVQNTNNRLESENAKPKSVTACSNSMFVGLISRTGVVDDEHVNAVLM